MATRLATSARNACRDATVGLVNAGAAAGTLKIRTGGQPATPNTAATGTLLCTFTLADPAYVAGAAGVADLDADPDLATTGVAAGEAGWYRVEDSDGNAVFDGLVGAGELVLNTTTISVDVDVVIESGTYTVPVG